jgi:riboflavin kinase / FMN adenylyltransferase
MQHVTILEDLQLSQPSMVTIGVFDGVHKGHQALIRQLVSEAHAAGQMAVVLSFHPHPDVFLRHIEGRYYLNTPEERAALLGELGVDLVVTHPFNEDVRTMRAANFVEKLVQHLRMDLLRVGTDFAMGYQREGNVAYLTELGQKLGYELRPIELVQNDGVISSSSIRQLLTEGKVEEAAELLGRSYSVSGEVVKGDQRGRTIGFPTANMAVWSEQVLPMNGVYAGWAWLGEERFMAVSNLGVRPTFDGTKLSLEPYLLDFDRDIYGQTLRLSFEKRLRGEQKFPGLDALKAQLNQDIATGRSFLETLK